ncbi:hypothetical protein [Aldersonia kunmingensis]|uniref:hypothetical protein n=1 Tax=Aldersonia kunmingensis TaxID=408066 RepID=UPI00082CE849|nr:hypothetical protein [Aldersonia kunmingensis]
MTEHEQFDLPAVAGDSAVFGVPFRTPDGVTIIPVTRPAGWFRPARPLGIFVIDDGKAADEKATWHAVTDDTALATFGTFVGLAATVLSLIAVVRRPPWPDVTVRVHRRMNS